MQQQSHYYDNHEQETQSDIVIHLNERPLPPLPDTHNQHGTNLSPPPSHHYYNRQQHQRPASTLPPLPSSCDSPFAASPERYYTYGRWRAVTPLVLQPVELSQIECIVCYTGLNRNQIFHANQCQHAICSSCLCQYLKSYIETVRTDYQQIPCPFGQDCQATYKSQDIVPRVMERADADTWWLTIIRRSVMDSFGVCPHEGCDEIFELCSKVRRRSNKFSFLGFTFRNPSTSSKYRAVCFGCRQSICLKCEGKWHPGTRCIEGQHSSGWTWPMSESDRRNLAAQVDPEVLIRLAEKKGWMPCPRCHEIVERSAGCSFITCTCNQEFCYGCGSKASDHKCSRMCHNLSKSTVKEIVTENFAVIRRREYQQ